MTLSHDPGLSRPDLSFKDEPRFDPHLQLLCPKTVFENKGRKTDQGEPDSGLQVGLR